MNVKFALIIGWLVSIGCFSSGVESAEDFMDLSLKELGEIPVTSIATGTPKPVYQVCRSDQCRYR